METVLPDGYTALSVMYIYEEAADTTLWREQQTILEEHTGSAVLSNMHDLIVK